jgi:predicted TIM-barrel enzyme
VADDGAHRRVWEVASMIIADIDSMVFIAGYTNHLNASRLARAADGVFVGSYLERDGVIDKVLVRRYVEAAQGSRTS